MNPLEIIKKYYKEDTILYNILVTHSCDVTRMALKIAKSHPELNLDTKFISEAGMLHDIGIYKTHAPSIECFGEYPYIAHGYLGAEILKEEGLDKHALVCERHTGTGLTLEEIIDQELPIPHRDMMPVSMEEQVICFADCFYSKTNLGKKKKKDKIRAKLARHSQRSAEQFDEWCLLFG